MNPEQASAADFAQVSALLLTCELPASDLSPGQMNDFLMLRSDDGLVGCVGLERAGNAGLLRSLAVAPESRSMGFGDVLLRAIEARAATVGIQRLFLLTTTAPDFFAARGYLPCPRSDAPDTIRSTTEFASICPASATCMTRPLGSTTSS
ncbi:amino-acid N-acetyltransferase [Variovorax boronicumulans]|uniref:arsenic resistance N-acetyltransferase ArsN2 n=1 Tax=Variovorax boronicumulans TaxID=436515 RepID=UPI0033975164